MSYKIKTLIVFDTNSLRSTEAGEVAYSFFAFGYPFQVVESFIQDNMLSDDVHLAIPAWAVEELKDQKIRQYNKDVKEFKKLAKRLLGLPHTSEISFDENNFDCMDYINEKAQIFLSSKDIKLLKIEESLASTILKNMMMRVLKDEDDKHPFVHAKKANKQYKDAGFKDNLIWESLIHFKEIDKYDKVIFLTKDSDFSNCKDEFEGIWNKYFEVVSDENNAIAELKKDYGNYIEERVIYNFAQSDYFRQYLFDLLKDKSEILINGTGLKIENFSITNLCAIVERIPPTDDEDEKIIIRSEIKIFFTQKNNKEELQINANTILADDVSKEVLETTFEPELT